MPTPSLTRAVRSTARAASRRPKTTVLLWLAMVIALAVGGSVLGTTSATALDGGVGQSGSAAQRLADAGLTDQPVEHVLVHSPHAATTTAAARDLEAALATTRVVTRVTGPARTPALRADGGRTVLVEAVLRGTPDDAATNQEAVARRVAVVQKAHPGARFQQAGQGSFDAAVSEVVTDDLGRAELVSLPVTLLILLAAFGAFLAASIPLFLGLTAVAAAIGGMAFYSHLSPVDDNAFSLIVLIGLAVGVDYSLFAVRRLREEHAKGTADPLDVVASTVGRAIVVSGATVIIAIAGLLLTGLPVFTSVAAGTILVVLLAVLGSLTVLPALLALAGKRVARTPRGRRSDRVGVWGPVANAVTRRPVAWLVTSVCILGSLCAIATKLDTAGEGISTMPADLAVVQAEHAITASFPGSPEPGTLVVRGTDLGAHRAQLTAFGERAREAAGSRGAVEVAVSRDARTAAVTVPLPGDAAGERAVAALRADLDPGIPGATAELTGGAAEQVDFTHRLQVTTPIVVVGVLLLAFLLLLASFRSPRLAAGVIALNLLSVGAAYGVVVGIFQYTWAEDLLGFTSSGTVVDYVPLLAFVILFGVSMDYTVLVLERVREARRSGLDARAAAAEGVARTAGSVTSAAVVMVAVFAILGSLRLLSMKQMGVGLGAAVLIDATIVRALALPALLTLLGDGGWDDRRRALMAPTRARAVR